MTVVDTSSIEKTLDKILGIINNSCATINLINGIDELEDVIDIIINKNNGGMEQITYNIKGFKEPLIRKVNVSDSESAKRFIENIKKNKDKREYLSELYNLSEYRKTTICAPSQEKLDNIIEELKQKGYVLDE